MPVHPHHRSKRLKPEWIAQPAQKLASPIVDDHRLGNRRPERGHSFCQPHRNAPAVQRQISYSRSLHRNFILHLRFARHETPPFIAKVANTTYSPHNVIFNRLYRMLPMAPPITSIGSSISSRVSLLRRNYCGTTSAAY